ncbi:hypothetical protein CONPUDRAFT_140572 [Coniophora puteana RWD-64-598 SS2]|uniref:Nuclear pore complex protein n=1 Tax=Coniophora puteana (strain RWD-64-598) TaxID=741705 RepID=R7SEM1_CONPW|nr:uncharacterized protein CONPUDRAFT_140572 [Coniophora puteana RWD-64-598 SS2]EIW74182.1 hypothetical protein CONPUDRAFT_140572 [Coniophora puteana RWD-64-598 SS2]
MSESLFSSCAEVLSLCQHSADDLSALLDPDTGFAPRLRKLCTDELNELERGGHSHASAAEVEALRMEANTWGLLQAVMPARKTEPEPSPSPRELLAENPYTPTSTLAQAIMKSSPLLSELIVVREWLHETAPSPQYPEATTGYWKFTKHNVMQALRTGGSRDGLVKEMDPDAANRGDGKSLAADDSRFEKSLAQALYTFVRAGRLEDAVEICRKSHQPWRAASIRGSLLFQWRAIAHESAEDDGADDYDDAEGWQGNRHRRQWKRACARAANNTSLSDSERALYAALAPCPETFTVLKSACRTWEDHLWAQVCILCEEKQSQEMLKLGGGFWDEGLAALKKLGGLQNDVNQGEEEEEWLNEATASLEGLSGAQVEDGPPADHAFHVCQLAIIMDRIHPLLEGFASGLQNGMYEPSMPEYATMTRFFAHLALFLQMIDVSVPPLATQVVLEAYLQLLESAGQRELIAMYAGALGENAVERYAMFLTSLELNADINERRMALTRAREHGLDMSRVAIVTAERTIERAFNALPSLSGPLPSIVALQAAATSEEMLLLRSIEWTTFMDNTYKTALEQATVILRYFLGSGRIKLAQSLLELLPAELASIDGPEELSVEYLNYRQFFTIWEALDRVTECRSLEVSLMGKEARLSWLKDYKGLIDQAYELIEKLLTSDWLFADDNTGTRRAKELGRIRQIYVPELIIRVHALLFTSRTHIPENLRRCLMLATVVADSRYKLYDDFLDGEPRKLGEYLQAVRQATLAGIEGGGSDLFRVISQ